jgi:hypothetical protein
VRDGVDDFIAAFGRDCSLVYPATFGPCPNCEAVSMPGGVSSSRWRTGGPIPFPNGVACPACQGTHRRANEVRATVRLICHFNPEEFIKPFPTVDVNVPFSAMQTRGAATDMPSVVRADRVLEPVTGFAYKREGEPWSPSNFVPGRWFYCNWQRCD